MYFLSIFVLGHSCTHLSLDLALATIADPIPRALVRLAP